MYLETVTVEDWLDHDEALGQVLAVQTPAVESSLVRGIVENLKNNLKKDNQRRKLPIEQYEEGYLDFSKSFF